MHYRVKRKDVAISLPIIDDYCQLHQQPNSPDLNLVDHKILGIVQQCVYQSRVQDVEAVGHLARPSTECS